MGWGGGVGRGLGGGAGVGWGGRGGVGYGSHLLVQPLRLAQLVLSVACDAPRLFQRGFGTTEDDFLLRERLVAVGEKRILFPKLACKLSQLQLGPLQLLLPLRQRAARLQLRRATRRLCLGHQGLGLAKLVLQLHHARFRNGRNGRGLLSRRL